MDVIVSAGVEGPHFVHQTVPINVRDDDERDVRNLADLFAHRWDRRVQGLWAIERKVKRLRCQDLNPLSLLRDDQERCFRPAKLYR